MTEGLDGWRRGKLEMMEEWMKKIEGWKDWMDGEEQRFEMAEEWMKKNEDWMGWMDRKGESWT